MLTTVLLMQLAAGEVPLEVREQARVRGGIHFAVTGAVSGHAVGFGPGLSAELGATFADRFSAVVRGTVGTIRVSTVATIGLGLDYAFSDRWSLGIQPSIGLVGGLFYGAGDLPLSLAIFAPVRLVFAPLTRPGDQVVRRGLVIFLEAGPGFGLVMGSGFRRPSVGPSPFSLEAAIGVGYAVW
ncbi:MAG: hypothetical protein Q8N23_28605 [Archangium sp.]|nr:hypothetical protein [Archangium sp.]MDP3570608.1 hypothetical protein [Archangium sp.]